MRVSFPALFFFSSRRRHTRFDCDWSSDVCSSDLGKQRPRSQPGIVAGVADFSTGFSGRVREFGTLRRSNHEEHESLAFGRVLFYWREKRWNRPFERGDQTLDPVITGRDSLAELIC